MKIRKSRKNQDDRHVQSFQDVVLLDDNDHEQSSQETFNKKPKERRSLGGKVEKTKTKVSRFSRFSLRNLLKRKSVAPEMNFTVATGSPIVEFGMDQSIHQYNVSGLMEKSDGGYSTLDAGSTPPKRGMLKKVNSSLVEEKILGNYKTDEAGHTPKSKGKLKNVDPKKVMEMLSGPGKENVSVVSGKKRPFLKHITRNKPLLRSKSDKHQDQVVPHHAEVDRRHAMLCLTANASAVASPCNNLFSKFASTSQVSPLPSGINISKSGKKRNSSVLDATFVTRDAGSTPKRTRSVNQSRRSAYLQNCKAQDLPTELNLSLKDISSDEEIIACAAELRSEEERIASKRKAESSKKSAKKKPQTASSEDSEGLLSDKSTKDTRRSSARLAGAAATKDNLIPSSSDEDIVACAADLMAHERTGTVRRNHKVKHARKAIDIGKLAVANSKNESIKKPARKKVQMQSASEVASQGLLTSNSLSRRSSARLAAKTAGGGSAELGDNSGGMELEQVCEERLV